MIRNRVKVAAPACPGPSGATANRPSRAPTQPGRGREDGTGAARAVPDVVAEPAARPGADLDPQPGPPLGRGAGHPGVPLQVGDSLREPVHEPDRAVDRPFQPDPAERVPEDDESGPRPGFGGVQPQLDLHRAGQAGQPLGQEVREPARVVGVGRARIRYGARAAAPPRRRPSAAPPGSRRDRAAGRRCAAGRRGCRARPAPGRGQRCARPRSCAPRRRERRHRRRGGVRGRRGSARSPPYRPGW